MEQWWWEVVWEWGRALVSGQVWWQEEVLGWGPAQASAQVAVVLGRV